MIRVLVNVLFLELVIEMGVLLGLELYADHHSEESVVNL